MLTPHTSLMASELRAAMVRDPLTVSMETTVSEAIARMSGVDRQPGAQFSCVLVLASDGQIVGIVTQRDVIRLVAQAQPLDQLSVAQVMTHPVITVLESEFTDLVATLHLLHHHQIRHLPIVDAQQQLVGLVTHDRLQPQVLEAEKVAWLAQQTSDLEQQRQQMEVAQQVSEQRYATLAAISPVGIFRTDAAGLCTYVNDRWCQLAGLNPADAMGQGWQQALYAGDRDRISAEWQQAVANNRPFNLEYRFQRPDGVMTWVYGQTVAERDAAGQILGYVGTITDISEQKATLYEREVTQQILKIQRDFNQLIAEISSRFVDLQLDDLDTEINRTLQLLGEATQVDTCYLFCFSEADASSGELSGLENRTLSMTHEWSQPGYPRNIAQVHNVPMSLFPWANTRLLQREAVYIPDVATVPPEVAVDQQHWQQFGLVSVLTVPLVQKSVVVGGMGFASFSHPVIWHDETIRLLTMVAQTIASVQERMQAEQNLAVSEERLRLALSAANQGLYDLNLQTGEAIVNPEYALMLGYDPTTFQETNQDWLDRLHPDDQELASEIFRAYVTGELPEYRLEFRQRTQSSEYKWILSLGKIVAWDPDGRPLRMLGTHTDITERKQAEVERLQVERTRQELKLLEQILDVVLAGYWDWDIPNNQEYLSPGFKRMFGYADHELPNRPESWQQLIFPEDLASVLEVFDRHVQSRGQLPYYNEVRYRHKDGSTVWVICSGQVIEWDAAGHPLRMIGCHIDITARKQAEAQLQATKEEIERFFTVALDLLCIADLDGYFRRLNLAWESTLGYPLAELEGQRFLDFVHPDDLEPTLAMIATLNDQNVVAAFINRYRCRDGSYRYIEWYSRPFGNLIYAAARDITAQKETEIRLRKTATHLSLAQRIGKLGSWEFDLRTGAVQWSDEVFRIFGRDPALGAPDFDSIQQILHPEDRDRHAQTVERAIATAQPYDIEFRAIGPEGRLVYVQGRGEPILDGTGSVIQFVGTVLDITEAKRIEEKIRQSAAQLEASNRELEAFAYSVSHDLRAPLRAIDGFSQALLEDYGDRFDPEAQDYFNRIRKNVTRMGTLIEDLLSLSRVSRLEIRYTTINLSGLVQEIVEDLQASAPERLVEWQIAPNVYVAGDTTLTRMVLTNLLQNAWKFTSHHPTARIEFGVTQQEETTVYFVRDDGAGFDMAFTRMLFGVFQRLHDTHEFPGTGIGLATVQRAIHRQGGRVWAEAGIEQGATFYFTLPQAVFATGE